MSRKIVRQRRCGVRGAGARSGRPRLWPFAPRDWPGARHVARPDALTISVTRDHPTDVVVLEGDLTDVTAAGLSDCLELALTGGAERIVVDLRGIASLDPMGVITLLIAHLRALDDHRQLLLIPADPIVQQVIDRMDIPFDYVSP